MQKTCFAQFSENLEERSHETSISERDKRKQFNVQQ